MALALPPAAGLPTATKDNYFEYHVQSMLDSPTMVNEPPKDTRPVVMQPYNPQDYAHKEFEPTQRPSLDTESLRSATSDTMDALPPLPPRSPARFARDPKRLTAFLIPFPRPSSTTDSEVPYPQRFMIYTPPAPPLSKPAEGEKEVKTRKVQRKWQEEVRAAKTSEAKGRSWKGVRAGATKGISHLMGKTTNSSIDFLGRINNDAAADTKAEDGVESKPTKSKTSELEEMVLLYPLSVSHSPDALRVEFIESMMRTKTKAQRDAIIATGLLPVAEAIDIIATPVWPFGGLMEIDAVWAYGNIRGAKTARSVTKRLTRLESDDADPQKNELRLSFSREARIDVLERYLLAKCHRRDPKRFPTGPIAPTETEVLAAIGWNPSQADGEARNWEDEQWELREAKEDLKNVLDKGAKEWISWCKAFEKDPEKAVKK